MFAGVPVVPVSSKTGEGLGELLAVLDDAICSCLSERLEATAGSGDTPRLPIDRCFSIRGTGTVVTGTLHDGPVSVGRRAWSHCRRERTVACVACKFTGIPSARFRVSVSP